LVKWDKYQGNPVIFSPPENIELVGVFRDPYVWREGDSLVPNNGFGHQKCWRYSVSLSISRLRITGTYI
jgi:hypothetical protein